MHDSLPGTFFKLDRYFRRNPRTDLAPMLPDSQVIISYYLDGKMIEDYCKVSEVSGECSVM